MTLTVPRAGSDPGRAAQVRVEASGTGAAVAEFGQRAQEVFARVEKFQLDSQLDRAQVDATKALNDVRLEVEQIGDPNAAEQVWRERSTEIRATYAGDAGSLDQRSREKFGLAFDQMRDAHAFDLGRRFIRDRVAQREATYISYAHEAARQGATAAPELRGQLIAQNDELVDRMVADGVIDAAEGARRKLAIRGDIDVAQAATMVQDDPAGFLEAIEDPEAFPGLTAGQRAARRAQAQAELDRRTATAARDAEAAAKVQEKEIERELGDARAIFAAGGTWHDPDFLEQDAVRAHPDYAKTLAAQQIMQERPALAQMTPAELSKVVAEERARPLSDKYQTERIAVAEQAHAAAIEGWQTDPMAQARKVGLAVPDLDLDAYDPENGAAFMNGLHQRMSFAAHLEDKGYADEVSPFSRDETAKIKRLGGIDQSPEARASLAMRAASAVTSDGRAPLLDILDDPVMAHVGGLQLKSGGYDLAQEILRGQADLANGNVVMPSDRDRMNPAFEVLGAVFAETDAGAGSMAQVRQAADALYAARRATTDPAAEIDETMYRQAMHEVMGGTGQQGKRSARGGVQEFRDYPTILPMGVGVDHVERAFDRLGQIDGQDLSGNPADIDYVARGKARQARKREQWRAAAGGREPMIGGAPLTARDLGRLSIEAVGDDRYILRRAVKGGFRTIYDETGEAPFTFSLRQLLQEVRP